jgi:predicted nucleic acid-binding protein
MNIFIDTSAILTLLDGDDPNHTIANRLWQKILDEGATLVCTSYVIAETCALVQRRLGMEPVRFFLETMTPVFDIIWIDAAVHEIGVSLFLLANRRSLSLVDCTSFVVMRQRVVTSAFAFDRHFEEQGIPCLR